MSVSLFYLYKKKKTFFLKANTFWLDIQNMSHDKCYPYTRKRANIVLNLARASILDVSPNTFFHPLFCIHFIISHEMK